MTREQASIADGTTQGLALVKDQFNLMAQLSF